MTGMRSLLNPLLGRVIVALLAVLLIWNNTPLNRLDRVLSDLVLTTQNRAGSGEVVVIEANVEDLRAFGGPPLERDAYARLIEKLVHANVERVYLDIVFETELDRVQDERLAHAMAGLGPSRLAIGVSGNRVPIEVFQEYATLADTNLFADGDGWFRAAKYVSSDGRVEGGASWLVGGQSAVSRVDIDQRVDPSTIPSFSIGEALEMPSDTFASKLVVIGLHSEISPSRVLLPFRGEISRGMLIALAADSAHSGYTRNHVIEQAAVLGILLGLCLAGAVLPSLLRTRVLQLSAIGLVTVCVTLFSEFFLVATGLPVVPIAFCLALTTGAFTTYISRLGLMRMLQELARGDMGLDAALAWTSYGSEHRPVLFLSASAGLKRCNADAAKLVQEIDEPIAPLCMPRIGQRAEQIEVIMKNGEVRTFGLHWPHQSLPIVSLTDLSAIIVEHRELKKKLAVDELTGLASRIRFDRELQSAADAGTGDYTVVYMDLNDLKFVNDTFGHAAGDALLAEAGRRFKAVLRDTDTLARLGGDEFAIVIPKALSNPEQALLHGKLEDSMIREVDIGETKVQSGVAVGMAVPASAEEPVESVVKRADSLMYQRKREMKTAA